MLDLVKFEAVGKKNSLAKVNITKTSSLVFNKTACEKFKEFFSKNDYVECYFSKEECAIVLFFTKEQDKSNLKISKTASSRCVIALKSFFNHFKIDMSKVVNDNLPKEAEINGKKCLVINLLAF